MEVCANLSVVHLVVGHQSVCYGAIKTWNGRIQADNIPGV